MPPARIERSDLQVITRYRPTEERLRLGGDFLDVMSLPRKGLALIIGDVSGHGPAAAALGATLRASWQALVMSDADRATVRATLSRERIGEEGLVSRLRDLGRIDEPAIDALLSQVEAANGGPMNDDVALVVVSRRS